MALSEFEIKKYERAKASFLQKRRPHPTVREKCDLDCKLSDQTVEVFEIRPQWDDPAVKLNQTIAKATYNSSQKQWNIYWQDSKLKWREYGPDKHVTTIEQVFTVIDTDETGVFFG